ncbi:MAG: fluoride efflux transporter CrcB [Acidobacteria bacterium]|nr:fluoride efflux transporter CrcB [Acidobacteriota bacterium]
MLLFLLIVFGAVGTLSRYGLQGWVQSYANGGFPVGTLAVNLLGCFLLGGIGRFALQHLWVPPESRTAASIGFLGAFTTFSTFGWETFRMLEDGEWLKALLYGGISVGGGIFGVMLGAKLADLL